MQTHKLSVQNVSGEFRWALIYVFEARIVKIGEKYLIYPPKEYQEKLKKLHGEKVKVIIIKESN
ncbi:MAG: hypothetical protein B6V02_02210 [Thermoprotei archaeon ex4572_64]|nr:MAG: hypothetical protein B6V02_02210 [Thermoprotei archaeon ex4572_64]